jgi:hypothetical protein
MIKSPEVDKIREKFDKMSQVWPAHIRMIYPFPVEKHFPHFIRLIQAAIDQLDMKQFQMTLERVDAFMQKTNHSIVIRPDKKSSQKIVDLYKLVMPHIDTNIKRRYNPRILCGKIHRERIMNAAPKKQRKKIRKMNMKHQRKQITDVMQKLNEDWEPVQVTIDSFQLLQLNEVSGEVETIHEFKLE